MLEVPEVGDNRSAEAGNCQDLDQPRVDVVDEPARWRCWPTGTRLIGHGVGYHGALPAPGGSHVEVRPVSSPTIRRVTTLGSVHGLVRRKTGPGEPEDAGPPMKARYGCRRMRLRQGWPAT